MDLEAAFLQAHFEFSVCLRRPDGQHSGSLESRVGRGNSAMAVKPGVACGGECRGTIVDIEQHGIEVTSPRSEGNRDIRGFHAHSRVQQRMAGQWAKQAPIPLDDCGHQFAHHDGCAAGQKIEHGTQRKPHAESTDEHASSLDRTESLEGERGQLNLRIVQTAGHEHVPTAKNQVFRAAANEFDGSPVGRDCLVEQLERLHEGDGTEQCAEIKTGPLKFDTEY